MFEQHWAVAVGGRDGVPTHFNEAINSWENVTFERGEHMRVPRCKRAVLSDCIIERNISLSLKYTRRKHQR